MWWFVKGCKPGYQGLMVSLMAPCQGHFFFLYFCQGPSLKHFILWLCNPATHRWRCCVFTKASGFSHNVKPSPGVWKNKMKCLFTIWLTVKVHFKSDLHMYHQSLTAHHLYSNLGSFWSKHLCPKEPLSVHLEGTQNVFHSFHSWRLDVTIPCFFLQAEIPRGAVAETWFEEV